jgi:hypothetical protein
MSPAAISNIRKAIACAGSICIGATFYRAWGAEIHHRFDQLLFGVTVAVPCVAGGLIWSQRLVAQLLARGTWWSMMLFGTLMSLAAYTDDRRSGATIATCAAVALVAAGRTGLENRGRFAPVAYRGTLLVALVLAMADAGGFLWVGTADAVYEHRWSVLAMVPPMVVGVIGLLQLRVWGLIVSLATNATIAILAVTQVLALPSPLRQLFAASAVLQILVPLPMLVAMVRHRAPHPDAWRRTKLVLPTVIITTIAALSLYAAYIHHGRLLDL